MSNHTGQEGVAKFADSAIAELRSFTVTETAETVDDTVKGDAWRTNKVTLKSWTAEAVALWDETDTNGQQACTIGAEGVFTFCFEGDTAGDTIQTGTGIVTERSIESPEDGLVPINLSIQGTGALVEGVAT
jgi:hypothetical protein